MELPDVFAYDDYRPFLQDWFKMNKRRTGKKGTSEFGRLASCTPGHVRNVVTGRRNLHPELIAGFCRALGFSAEGATFFALLVRHAHPLSAADRVQAAREIRAMQTRLGPGQVGPRPAPRGRPRKVVEDEVSEFTDWFHPVVRALARCPGFQDSPAWIAQCLRPAISPLRAASLLRSFPGAAEGMSWSESPVIVPSVGDAPTMKAYYRQALRVVHWALHNVPGEEASARATTISVRPSTYARLMDEVHAYEREIEDLFRRARDGILERQAIQDPDPNRADIVDVQHGPPNVVYQLTIQIFPLASAGLGESGR